MPPVATEAYDQRIFLRSVRSIGPESSSDSIRAVIDQLRDDRKAQMGRLYLARQAKLHGVHLADFYMPRFVADAWQPRAYLGAAFFAEPEAPQSELVKQRLFGQQYAIEGAMHFSVEHQPGARATVSDVWPEALAPASHAVTVVPPELIPLDDGAKEALAVGAERHERVLAELAHIIVALREAVAAFDAQYTILQMFQAKRRSLLGTTLTRAQDTYRQAEGLWHRIQREVYAVPLGLPTEKPGAIMTANRATGCFAELVFAMNQIRTNLSYLNIAV